jgi:hypothetical protein
LKEKLLAKRKLQDLKTRMKKKAEQNDDPPTGSDSSEEGEVDEGSVPNTPLQPDDKEMHIGETPKQRKKRMKRDEVKFRGPSKGGESGNMKKILKKQRKREAKESAANMD